VEAGVGLLDTRISKGIAPNDPFLGREFAGAPDFTGTAGFDWEPVRKLRVSAQVQRNSGFWGDDNNDPLFRTPGWSMVNGRVSWDARHFTLFGYAQNLFDTMRVIAYSGPTDVPGLEVGLTDPREIGVGLQARF
jgi:outer membrane receptor protein involved in Fe transport